MNKRKLLMVFLIMTLLSLNKPIVSYANVQDDAYQNEVNIITDTESTSYYRLKTLIVTSSKELTETYNAISANNCNDVLQILQYETEQDTKNAYYKLKNDGYQVAVDRNIDIKTENYDTNNYRDINNVVNNLRLHKAQELTYNKEEFRVAILDRPYNISNYPDDRIIVDTTTYTSIKRDENGNIEYKDNGDPYYTDYNIDFSIGSNSHGTHVASVILDSTSSNVKIYSYNAGIDHHYVDSTGEHTIQVCNTVSNLTQEIEKIIKDDCKIVNMSIQWSITNPILQTQMKALLDSLHNKGIIIIAAAGNDNTTINSNMFPQCLDYTINVSSVDENKNLSNFSNNGDIDFCAPGEEILTLDNYLVSGTSFSAPYITSFIAEILQINTYKDPVNEIEDSLSTYCVDLGKPGKDEEYGNGFPVFYTTKELCEQGNHQYETTTINPTCINEGYSTSICIYCGDIQEESIKALGHDYKTISTVEPTCTTEGYTILECSRCHDIIRNTLNKIDHEPITITTLSTCISTGCNIVKCNRCNTILYETSIPINKNNHTFIESIENPTCQHNYYVWNICKECGYKTIKTTYGNTTDHEYVLVNNKYRCKYCNYAKPTTSSTTEESVKKPTTEQPTSEQKITTDTTTTKPKTYKIKTSWKKIKKAKLYKVQISTSKKFTKKTIKTIYTKKTTYTFKNLKKKTYYIRIKPKYSKKYGYWSKTKKYKAK